jgi:hypothetical protein
LPFLQVPWIDDAGKVQVNRGYRVQVGHGCGAVGVWRALWCVGSVGRCAALVAHMHVGGHAHVCVCVCVCVDALP